MSEPRTLYQIGFINDPSSPDTLRWMIDHGVLVPVSVDDLNIEAMLNLAASLFGFRPTVDEGVALLRAALGGTDHE